MLLARDFLISSTKVISAWVSRPRAHVWHGHLTSATRPLSIVEDSKGRPPHETFRRLQKQALKEQRESSRKIKRESLYDSKDKWQLTVGIEVHAQLNVDRKLFSRAPSSGLDDPNTRVAEFDLASPGSQPELQKATLIPALRAALALNSSICLESRFDRKHYFYPDQPSGYQITQYFEPIARDGYITLFDHDGIAPEDGEAITIGIKQIQIEQDTAKTWQQSPETSLLDLNRVSHPLIEIITLPQIHYPATAAACVRKIQATLSAVNACTSGMELGGLRADVNVSMQARNGQDSRHQASAEYYGIKSLGQRTEIKNLNSTKAVSDAIKAESHRQIEILESGGTVKGETRHWALGSTQTAKLRGKEGEVDYRYMPDPDLHPTFVGQDLVDYLRRTVPLPPDGQLQVLTDKEKYNLTIADAKTLLSVDDGRRVNYYFQVVELVHERLKTSNAQNSLPKIGRTVGNWVLHEIGSMLSTENRSWEDIGVTDVALADIITLLSQKHITGKTAKCLLQITFRGDPRSVHDIVESQSLLLVPMSDAEYELLARRVMDENSDVVRDIQESGKIGKRKFLVGQMMRAAEDGSLEPLEAEKTLERLLRK